MGQGLKSVDGGWEKQMVVKVYETIIRSDMTLKQAISEFDIDGGTALPLPPHPSPLTPHPSPPTPHPSALSPQPSALGPQPSSPNRIPSAGATALGYLERPRHTCRAAAL